MGIAIPCAAAIDRGSDAVPSDDATARIDSRHRFAQASEYILAVVQMQQKPMMNLERRIAARLETP
jgi:hypothetical protein